MMRDINGIIARQKRHRLFKRTCLAIIALIIILAIVIPIGIIFSTRRTSKGLKSSVLVPLYIYPSQNAWDPLYKAIDQHQSLNFTIIINPDSGPGSTQFPNDDFSTQIRRLNAYQNVRTIGYVRTNYSVRPIAQVAADIAVYSGWAGIDSNHSLAMKGIFFDEAVSQYSAEAHDYLQNINQLVQNSTGIIGEKIIVHNPGTIPDANLEDDRTDVTVIFEGPYSDLKTKQDELKGVSGDRSKYSYIVHSVPSDTSINSFGKLIDGITYRASSLYFTYLTKNYYESFGSHFDEFINLIPSR